MFKRKTPEYVADIQEIKKEIKFTQKMLDDTQLMIRETFPRIDELEQKHTDFENKIDKKLIDFYKEFTDKYFENISAFINWNKDLALVAHMDRQDPSINKLKQSLMRPFVENGWKETNAKKAIAINKAIESNGESIRKSWEKYKAEKLKLEREQKSTAFVDAKLEVLNILMEGVEIKEIQT